MSDGRQFEYERTDVESTLVLWIAIGLASFVIATPLLMPIAFPQSMQHRSASAPPALSMDAPRLEITPRQDLHRLQRGEEQFAGSYGWTNREHTTVHIPIRRAMSLLAQRGLAGWPAP